MVTVRRIRSLPGAVERAIVEVEGKGRFLVSRGLAAELEVGMALDDRLLRRLASEDLLHRALQVALRLLRIRLYSRAEMTLHLKRRGFPPQIVTNVIRMLEQQGVLNDLQFAKTWITGVMARRPAWQKRLEAELRAKGVVKEVIAQALDEALSGTTEVEVAREVALRRLRAYHRFPPEVQQRRLISFLQRRGFTPETATSVVRELVREEGSRES
ncbi:MAG: RecX family transcriptional regulator [Armatimonadota bacterium]|nr:RecX family transcriptional regulator [Armatimonadota bacterium]MDR5702447.1 RecX family transcriptional regulator [Armatimonadota bacterium]MDR7434314.1 RecX family transcriptional regulator [Armatimonadota bacterium]